MLVVYQTQNSNTPSIASATTALASNPKRIVWNIQNLGMNALYVLLGTGASTSVFHFVLKAGTANDDGTGGTVGMEEGVIYTGSISIAGTSPRYTVLEIAPGTLTAPN
jgi:hypothetical protein